MPWPSRIQFTAEPFLFNNGEKGDSVIFKISLDVDGRELHNAIIRPFDFFKSSLDLVFDIAKMQIKEELEKESQDEVAIRRHL